MTDTTQFLTDLLCESRQLVMDLLRGNWCNGFWSLLHCSALLRTGTFMVHCGRFHPAITISGCQQSWFYLVLIAIILLTLLTGGLTVQWLGHRICDQELVSSIPSRALPGWYLDG